MHYLYRSCLTSSNSPSVLPSFWTYASLSSWGLLRRSHWTRFRTIDPTLRWRRHLPGTQKAHLDGNRPHSDLPPGPHDLSAQSDSNDEVPATNDSTSFTPLPRVPNRYNEDWQRWHHYWNSHPWEEWVCRSLSEQRHWFYRSWSHLQTVPDTDTMLDYYRHTSNHYVDLHPDFWGKPRYYRVWTTHGWQFVLTAMATEPIWQLCDSFEAATATQQAVLDSLPRGTKRQAVEALESQHLDRLVDSLVQRLLDFDISGNPALHGLTPMDQQHVIGSLIHQLARSPQKVATLPDVEVEVVVV